MRNCFLLRSESDRCAELFGTPAFALPKKRIKTLKTFAWISYAFMIFMQMWLIFTFKGELTSDAAQYVEDAMKCVNFGGWYPKADNFIGGGVAGTGYVNFLVLLFRIVPDVRIAYAANFLFVQLLLFSTLYIAQKTTGSETVRYVVMTMFCLFGTFWSEVCVARTELFFTAIAFFAMALIVKNGKISPLLGGFLLMVANWARPVAISFVVAAFWLYFYKRVKWTSFVKLAAGITASVLLISSFTYYSSGIFEYQPTVAGANILMGANDDADGSYSKIVFTEGKAGYIDPEIKKTMSYKEIGDVYSKAVDKWISENRGRYIALMPIKLMYLYATETYSGDVYFDNEIQTGGISYIKELVSIFSGNGDRELQGGDIAIIYTQGFYMLVFLLFLVGVIYSMKNGYWRSMSFLYGTIIAGTCMVMLSVGGARYHFPYIPIMLITASQFIDAVFIRKGYRQKS